MHVPIKSVEDLGYAVRATRTAQELRLDDLAGCAKVSHVFARHVEHGKETIQLGLALRLLHELGIRLYADIPDNAQVALERLRATGMRPLKKEAQAAEHTLEDLL